MTVAAPPALTRLSVNLNKVALLRNARSHGEPGVVDAARIAIEAGAPGITLHPRPDRRHILPEDVCRVADHVRDIPGVELNVEGNPFPEFMELVRDVRPDQCTLVPDDPAAKTSDHGWEVATHAGRLGPVIAELRGLGIRVSLFMDADSTEWELTRSLGAERVELYTEPYAAAYAAGEWRGTLARYAAAARAARAAGLGVNAGHDLNLRNLPPLLTIPGILEVSIGHALIADALKLGLAAAVAAYLKVVGAGGQAVPVDAG